MDIITAMKQEQHPLNLGRLLANFQSLEFALRSVLVNDEVAQGHRFSESAQLHKLKEGQIVTLNTFTNYDDLRTLIRKFNSHSKIISEGLTIDESLADLRDALAHGRVSGELPSSPFQLLKFSKPRKNENQVKVTFCVSMTAEWFSEQIVRTKEAILKVIQANRQWQGGKL